MKAKTLATLTNTNVDAWILADAHTGNVLTGLTGPEALVLKCAAASLVADSTCQTSSQMRTPSFTPRHSNILGAAPSANTRFSSNTP